MCATTVRHTGILVLFALSAVVLPTAAAAPAFPAAFAFATPGAVYLSHSGFGSKPPPRQEAVARLWRDPAFSRSFTARGKRGFRVTGRREKGEGFAESAATVTAAVSMDTAIDPKIIDGEKKRSPHIHLFHARRFAE